MAGVNDDSYTMTSETTMDPMWTTSQSLLTNETFGNETEARNVTVRMANVYSEFYKDLLRPILTLIMGGLGLPSLVLLLAIMMTPKYKRYSYSLYIAVMSVYDFIFILLEFIQTILKVKLGDKFIALAVFIKWDFPCKMFEHIYYTSMNISIWLNVAVAVDRFIVITFPFKKDAWCNRRNSWIVTVGLMVIVHSAGIVYYVNAKVAYTTILDIGHYCARNPILGTLDVYMSNIGGVLSGIIIIGFFSTMSVVKLHVIRRKRQKMTSNQSTSKQQDKTSRATVALVSIGVSAFVTQAPYIANEMVRLYAELYDRRLFYKLWFTNIPGYNAAVQTFEALSFFINVQNFFFMFILNGPFRSDVIAMLTCGRTTSKKESTGATSTKNVSVTVVSE